MLRQHLNLKNKFINFNQIKNIKNKKLHELISNGILNQKKKNQNHNHKNTKLNFKSTSN